MKNLVYPDPHAIKPDPHPWLIGHPNEKNITPLITTVEQLPQKSVRK